MRNRFMDIYYNGSSFLEKKKGRIGHLLNYFFYKISFSELKYLFSFLSCFTLEMISHSVHSILHLLVSTKYSLKMDVSPGGGGATSHIFNPEVSLILVYRIELSCIYILAISCYSVALSHKAQSIACFMGCLDATHRFDFMFNARDANA